MGACVTVIIKNDLQDRKDGYKMAEYGQWFCEKYNRHFHSTVSYNCHTYIDDDGFEVTINIPEGLVRLHPGFWEVFIPYHYVQLFLHDGNWFWIRDMVFNLVLALGVKEAWYCDEYAMDQLDEDNNFEDFIQMMIGWVGEPQEYSIEQVLANEERTGSYINDLEDGPFYHDSFDECFDTYQTLSNQIFDAKGVVLLGLSRFGQNYLLVEDHCGVNLIHRDTLELLFNTPKEEIVWYSGMQYFIRCNEKYARFEGDGKQISPYEEEYVF